MLYDPLSGSPLIILIVTFKSTQKESNKAH
jgi:hypothetical protein